MSDSSRKAFIALMPLVALAMPGALAANPDDVSKAVDAD